MFDCILYDFDGTVYDTVEGITKSVRWALKKHGLDAELQELRCFAGPPLEQMFRERFGFTEEMARTLTAEFRERYNPIGVYESRPFPGIEEHLRRLRAAGKTVGLATSKPQELAELLLEKAGLLELFDVISGADIAHGRNLKWQMIESAMERSGIPPERTVLVGDTKYDVAGAHQMGIACIGVGWGYAAPGELEQAGADAIAANYAELERLLLSE